MKSYGRAPTFLMITGYEQVRSIAADIAGDATPPSVSNSNFRRPACARVAAIEAGAAVSGCCGGAAPAGVDACCADDVDAKGAGKSGCGCS